MTKQNAMVKVQVLRGGEHGSSVHHYEVPALPSQTVLDVVTWIQRHLEPDLAYRFACRVGMCGSCAMTVNGKPRWTCRTQLSTVLVDDSITIEPLRNMPVIKDLACDMSVFFAKWIRAKGVFEPSSTREEAVQAISPQDKVRHQADVGIECINCGVCYAACDVVEKDSQYLGPAALNRAWTLLNDVRDSAHDERLKAVSEQGGCQACHSQQACAHYCPKALNPTRSIAGLKRTASLAVLKGEI